MALAALAGDMVQESAWSGQAQEQKQGQVRKLAQGRLQQSTNSVPVTPLPDSIWLHVCCLGGC
jgi:hypothetical protein